ncbi:metalloprotease family protein, partial [Staphylococcus aureus]|uniref:metalloprotease family protein n=1 Tax=Staphylococcus aureus TaxID=1280 RepID=UPI001CB78C57
INRKSNVSYLKCVAFFSFIRLNNSHISSKVTIMLSPLILLSTGLLILIKVFGYSSLIFMFSMHTAYCFIDILLVALTISSSFKYVQQDEDSIYLYHQKPTQ